MKITLDMQGGMVIDGVIPDDLPALLRVISAANTPVAAADKFTTVIELSPKLTKTLDWLKSTEAEDGVSPSELAVAFDISKSAATQRITQLKKHGLVSRVGRGRYQAQS